MAETEQQMIAKALIADGFDPPPAVGQRWLDGALMNVLGEEELVEITSIGKTVSGWRARVERYDLDGKPLGRGGVLYVETLLSEFRLMDDVEG